MRSFLARHFRVRLWFLPLAFVWGYFVIKQPQGAESVIGFMKSFELSLFIPAFILAVSIFGNRAEMEFCRSYGFGLHKLCIAQASPFYVYSVIVIIALMLISPRSDSIATSLCIYLVLSSIVNLTFAMSISIFIRVLFRSMFGAIGFVMLFYFFFASGYGFSSFGEYFSFNSVSIVVERELEYSVIFINRLIYLAMSAIFMFLSYLLMKSKSYTEVN